MNVLRVMGGLGLPVVLGVGATLGGLLGEDERVEDLMEHVHEGKRSPARRIETEAAAAAVTWAVVDAALPSFDEMSQALVASKNDDIRGSADGYVEAVKEMRAAAARRSQEDLRTAFTSLKQSCGDCHFKGGVGGELDD